MTALEGDLKPAGLCAQAPVGRIFILPRPASCKDLIELITEQVCGRDGCGGGERLRRRDFGGWRDGRFLGG
jgi:hypothetical protein